MRFLQYMKTIKVSQKDKFGDAVGYALNQLAIGVRPHEEEIIFFLKKL